MSGFRSLVLRPLSVLLALLVVLPSRAALAQEPAAVPVQMVPSAEAPKAPAVTPTPAWPRAEDGEDVLLLRDGGMVRGYLEELLPGEHARIRLVSGQVSVIPWSRLHHVEQGTGPQRRVLVIAPLTTAPGEPARKPVTGKALVHIQGGDVTLALQNDGSWDDVCTTPCDRTLPLDGYYRIEGHGVRRSKIFRLNAEPGQRVVLNVETASSVGHGLGVTGVTLAGVLGGIAYLGLLGSVGNSYRHDSGAAVWGVSLLGSGVLAVGGIGLMVANAHTDVAQHVAAPTERLVAPREVAPSSPAVVPSSSSVRVEGRLDTRLPGWHTAQRDLATPQVPRATTVPVLRLAF